MVCFVDPSAPIFLLVAFQGFGFTDTRKRVAVNVTALRRALIRFNVMFFILSLPMQILVPRIGYKR
jgi:hypothetical protein